MTPHARAMLAHTAYWSTQHITTQKSTATRPTHAYVDPSHAHDEARRPRWMALTIDQPSITSLYANG